MGCQRICRQFGADVDLIGWVGVGLGGTYGCRCGILYVPMLGVLVVFFDGIHLTI